MSGHYKVISEIVLQNKLVFLSLLLINIIHSSFSIITPYLSKLQVDQLEMRYGDFFGVFETSPLLIFGAVILAMALANILEVFFSIISDFYGRKISYNCSVELEKKLYSCIEKFDIGFMQNPRNGRIVNSSMSVTSLIDNFLYFSTNQIGMIVSICSILPIAAYFNFNIFLILFFSGLIQIWAASSKAKKDMEFILAKENKGSQLWQLKNLIFYQLHNISNIDDAGFVMRKYWGLQKDEYEIGKKENKTYAKYSLLNAVVRNLTFVFIAFYVGFQVMEGSITVGSFVMITMYLSILQGVFRDLASVIPELNIMLIQFHKFGFFMNLKPRLKLDNIIKTKAPISGDIILKGVDFQYPSFYKEEKEYIRSIIKREGKAQEHSNSFWEVRDVSEWKEVMKESDKEMPIVLHDINLEFGQGKITALVGRNGSGKTTLTNLITRNYDPSRGDISIGDFNLVNVDPNYIRKYISIIPQDPFLLYSFSIGHNISFGRLDRKIRDRIWDILEVLNLKEEINSLPKKLDSIIGEDVCFSGGQAQLISIARVMFQNRPIIIFDEGTNQLDAEHEAKIMDILQSVKKDKTIIMITHRMTTASKADRICVMDEGKIIEQGKHSELIKKENSLYRKFWNLQVGNY